MSSIPHDIPQSTYIHMQQITIPNPGHISECKKSQSTQAEYGCCQEPNAEDAGVWTVKNTSENNDGFHSCDALENTLKLTSNAQILFYTKKHKYYVHHSCSQSAQILGIQRVHDYYANIQTQESTISRMFDCHLPISWPLTISDQNIQTHKQFTDIYSSFKLAKINIYHKSVTHLHHTNSLSL